MAPTMERIYEDAYVPYSEGKIDTPEMLEKGILNFAKETNANLIGMTTHGRKGLAHFFNGSISEDLVNHANMPVITFKI